MGDRIIGINAVKEVSRTRKAMNKHCTKVMLKSKDAGGVTTETQTEEESVMDAKIMKSFAGLQARVGATAMSYVAQLEEDKVKSFFEQSEADQDAEVKTWDDAEKKKAADAAEAEKKKAAGDPAVNELRAEVETLRETVKSLTGGSAESALKEKAKSLYPNVPKAYDVLKSIAGLDAEAQQPTLDMLAAQNSANVTLSKAVVDPSTIDGSAAQKLKAVVKSYANDKKVTEDQALLAISDMPEHADLIASVREEEEAA